MPELRECVAAALHIARFQTATPATALVVRELWADPTEEERVNALKDSRWSRGLVDVLTDTNPAVRGMAPRATAQDAIGTGRYVRLYRVLCWTISLRYLQHTPHTISRTMGKYGRSHQPA